MKRISVFALLGMIAAAGGCASQARVVSLNKEDGSGTVAIPSGTDVFPFFYKRAAIALIEQQVGPYYKITSEGEVVTGQSTQNTQQTNTEQTQNRRNPNLPGERQTTTGASTTQNIREYRITFVRLPAPQTPGNNFNTRGAANNVTPAGGFTAQGPPAGTVPSVLPAFR